MAVSTTGLVLTTAGVAVTGTGALTAATGAAAVAGVTAGGVGAVLMPCYKLDWLNWRKYPPNFHAQ